MNPDTTEARLLARILDVVPGGIVQIAEDGAISRANRQAQEFLGLSWDRLSERFITDFEGQTFYEDGSPCAVEDYPVTRCLATGAVQGPITLGVRQPDGELRWAIFTALPFPESGSGARGAVVTFVDITDRKRAEVRTRAHAQLLDTVRMVHSRDDAGAVVAVFHAPLESLLELTGSRYGFVARPIDEAMTELALHARIDDGASRGKTLEPHPMDALCRRVLGAGEPLNLERPGVVGGAWGRRELARAAVLPLRVGDRVVGVVGLADAPTPYAPQALAELGPLLQATADLVTAILDRQRRRKLEAQLAQAGRLASVGTLAAGMAHEINNPLAYVLLNLQAYERHARALDAKIIRLREALGQRLSEDEVEAALASAGLQSPGDVEAIRRHGVDALEGAERVQRIVRDLMTFSRVSEDQRSHVDVNEAVRIAIKMAHHEIKYRARLATDLGDLSPVIGHEGRLSQVFLNLLLNAARAIEEGHPDEHTITVRTWMEGDEIRAEVGDTGSGVPPEHLERLFDPFFSTRQHGAGAGLGLSICHSVVTAHGGRIAVDSQVGRGSRFTVSLPRARSAAPSAEAAVEEPRVTPPTQRRRLLLIDDEPMIVEVLGRLIAARYEVETADGLESAVARLRDDAAFDVILCDMMMLDGTGIDVHRWVSAHHPSLAPRMLFMTGGTFTPKARAFLDELGGHHLTKPFRLSELDEKIAALMAE